jgi:uncharacterized protein
MYLKNRLLHLFYLLALTLGFSVRVEALEIASLNSPVVDEVGLLPAGAKQQLEQSLFSFKQSADAQIQVYIIKSLQGDSIESAAIQIFDRWKLGDAKTDRGLLFLVAPNEKRMRIEVGQGLEGDIPDVIAKRIISDVVRPYFQRGEFAMGVFQGASAIQQYILNADPEMKKKLEQGARAQVQSKNGSGGWVIFILIGLWILVFIFNPSLALYILFSALSGGRGGGGGFGGGWGGGGGRSSGGGASGGW